MSIFERLNDSIKGLELLQDVTTLSEAAKQPPMPAIVMA